MGKKHNRRGPANVTSGFPSTWTVALTVLPNSQTREVKERNGGKMGKEEEVSGHSEDASSPCTLR